MQSPPLPVLSQPRAIACTGCSCCAVPLLCCRLDQALQEFMKDFADRMKEINTSLASSSEGSEGQQPGSTSLADKEALCDELMEIVENVDYARGESHAVHCLSALSSYSGAHQSLWPCGCTSMKQVRQRTYQPVAQFVAGLGTVIGCRMSVTGCNIGVHNVCLWRIIGQQYWTCWCCLCHITRC